MTVNIEKMRADMAAQNRQLAWESWKFALQLLLALIAAPGVGVGIGNLIWNRPQQSQPPIQVFSFHPARRSPHRRVRPGDGSRLNLAVDGRYCCMGQGHPDHLAGFLPRGNGAEQRSHVAQHPRMEPSPFDGF